MRLENENNNNRNNIQREDEECRFLHDVEMACNNSRNRIKEEEPQILNTMFSKKKMKNKRRSQDSPEINSVYIDFTD